MLTITDTKVLSPGTKETEFALFLEVLTCP